MDAHNAERGKRKAIIEHGGIKCYDNEFRRSMIMIKWPRDKRDSNTVPTG